MRRQVLKKSSPPRRHGAGLVDHHSTHVVGAGTWTCVEIDANLEHRAATLHGNEQTTIAVTLSDPSPVYSNFQVGAERADTPRERVIADDVVWADQHIGCQ